MSILHILIIHFLNWNNFSIINLGKEGSSKVSSLFTRSKGNALSSLFSIISTLACFQEKVDYGALIQELGGEYIDQDYFTTKCTHLVVGNVLSLQQCM